MSEWILTLTRSDAAGREIGRFASRDEALLAAEKHFEMLIASGAARQDDELGWQMSFNGATALSSVGVYRAKKR